MMTTTKTSKGTNMKKLLLAVLIVLALASIGAACSGDVPILDRTGVADVTPILQLALYDAQSAHGGSGAVRLLSGTYRLNGRLFIPDGVTLCGTTEGPFEPRFLLTNTVAATLMIYDNTGPAINMLGWGASLSDVMIYYPDQIAPTATPMVPVVYPYAIKVTNPGTIRRITIVNAYRAIQILVGRVHVSDSNIGGIYEDINIDSAYDFITLSNLTMTVWWDMPFMTPWPSAMDDWVTANAIASINVGKADSLHGSNIHAFNRRVGLRLVNSVLVPGETGYGMFNDVDLDTVKIGVTVQSSNSPGWIFSNLMVGGTDTISACVAGAPVQYKPRLVITGGSARSPAAWTMGAWSNWTASCGQLVVDNFLNP